MPDKKIEDMLRFWVAQKEATQDPDLSPMVAVNGQLGLEGLSDEQVLRMDMERQVERARLYAAYLRRLRWQTPRRRLLWRIAAWIGCDYFDAFQEGWIANGK